MADDAGTQLLTQVNNTVEYLKELWIKEKPSFERTFDEILNSLSLQRNDPRYLAAFKRALPTLDRIKFNPKGANGVGTYSFNPIIPARNEEELKAYLQSRPTSLGVKYEDIIDGWEEKKCLPVLDDMEKRHEILVLRASTTTTTSTKENDTKKTPKIKCVWQDDPTLYPSVRPDFINSWNEVSLPLGSEELRTALEKAGLKPTTAPREINQTVQVKEKKRKAPRRGGRQTNAHMAHLLKDYSHLRK
jgi:transcription initiation factor TFIIE subunit beta